MSTLASCQQQKQICRVKWLVQGFGDGGGFAFDQLWSALRTQHPSAARARGACLEHILCLGFIWNQFDSLALRAVRDGNESVVGSSERSGDSDQECTPEPNSHVDADASWAVCSSSWLPASTPPTRESQALKTEDGVFPSNKNFPEREKRKEKTRCFLRALRKWFLPTQKITEMDRIQTASSVFSTLG